MSKSRTEPEFICLPVKCLNARHISSNTTKKKKKSQGNTTFDPSRLLLPSQRKSPQRSVSGHPQGLSLITRTRICHESQKALAHSPKFFIGFDVAGREEADPGEPQVLMLHEDLDRHQVGLTQVVDEARHVAILAGVQAVCVTILQEGKV